MPSPDDIFDQWRGNPDNEFATIISQTLNLPDNDSYAYRAESFAMTLPQIQEQINSGK
jgi:hypothetical protein